MKLFAKILLAVVLLLLVLVSAVLVRPDWFKGPAIAAVQRSTGFELSLDAITTHVDPLRLELVGLDLRNPQASQPQLLRIGHLSASLSGSPFDENPFWSLKGSGIHTRIAQGADSRMNWTPAASGQPAEAAPESAQEPPGWPTAIGFERISLSDVTLDWEPAEGHARHLRIPELTVRTSDARHADLRLALNTENETFDITGSAALPRKPDGTLNYRLSLDNPHMSAQSGGDLQPGLTGSQLTLRASVDALQSFEPLVGGPLPAFESVGIETRLLVSDYYELSEFSAHIGENRIAGRIRIDPTTHRAQAELETGQIRLKPILAALPKSEAPEETGTEQPLNWAPLNAWSGRVEYSLAEFEAGEWTAEELKLVFSVDRDLRLSMNASRINHSPSGMDFPDVDLATRLEPLEPETMGADVQLTLNARLGDQLQGSVTGPANINGLPGSSLSINAAGSSAALWKALALPYKDAGQLTVAGKLDSRKDGMDGELQGRLGGQQLHTLLEYRTGTPAQAVLDVAANNLDLRFMQTAASEPPAPPPKQPNQMMLSDEPIDFSALKTVNAKVRLKIDGMYTGYSRLRSLDISPTLENGVLEVDNGTAQIDGGELAFDFTLDTTAESPRLTLTSQLKGSDFGAMGLTELAGMKRGRGIVDVKLATAGASSHALAANADGHVNLQIEDLLARNSQLDMLGSDLINQTFQRLNPFAKEEPNTKFQCIAIYFDASEGRFESDKNLVLETDKMKIVGTGFVDFKDESLSMSFTPIARKGLGVNMGNLVQLVRVAGTLNNPHLAADAGGMMSSAVSTGAAVYTGGLSILAEKLIQRAVNAGSACDPDAEPVEYDIPVLPSQQAPTEDGQQPAPSEDGDDASLQSTGNGGE